MLLRVLDRELDASVNVDVALFGSSISMLLLDAHMSLSSDGEVLRVTGFTNELEEDVVIQQMAITIK